MSTSTPDKRKSAANDKRETDKGQYKELKDDQTHAEQHQTSVDVFEDEEFDDPPTHTGYHNVERMQTILEETQSAVERESRMSEVQESAQNDVDSANASDKNYQEAHKETLLRSSG